MSSLPFKFRPAKDEDLNFIMDTWLKCARTIPPWPRIPNAAFYDSTHGYRAHVISTLKKAKVLVATSLDNDDEIYGYVCYEDTPPTLHFIYVKGGDKGSSMRSMKRKVGIGVGTEMMRAALPQFGKTETIATEKFRYADQWEEWCRKYRIRFVSPTTAPRNRP